MPIDAEINKLRREHSRRIWEGVRTENAEHVNFIHRFIRLFSTADDLKLIKYWIEKELERKERRRRGETINR